MFTNVKWYMIPFVWFVVAPLIYGDYVVCQVKRKMRRKYLK